jgi:hypothetical protein
MNKIKKIYYAHPVSLYNTPQEERDLATLKYLWPDAVIYNPNSHHDQQGYKEWGFNWFLDRVSDCDLLVFRSFPDGKIGAGVWKEVNWANVECAIPVIEIPMLMESRVLSVDDTREYLKHTGKR